MHPHHSPHSLSQLLWTMKLSLALLLLLLRVGASSGDFGDRLPLKASSPQLDEEEKFSAHMPPHLRCDACRAVTYQVSLSPPSPHTPPLITTGPGAGPAQILASLPHPPLPLYPSLPKEQS